jgi:hypothetical protein
MTILFTSVAQVRMGLGTIVQIASGQAPTTISVTAAPQHPNRPYTAKIPAQYRHQVYEFLTQRLRFAPVEDDGELLTLTYEQAAYVVKLATRVAERAGALESL